MLYEQLCIVRNWHLKSKVTTVIGEHADLLWLDIIVLL